ncbi:hypothetical protein FRC01_007337, partial [Tulasnella sp. 417]
IHDILNGLEHIHGQTPPICHGDLKSHNILIDSSYHAVITDFGSARRFTNKNPSRPSTDDVVESPLMGAAEDRDRSSIQATFCAADNTITLTNNNYTLRWAAPELLLDDEVSPCSDIWALGWIVYEVLTGDIPFPDVDHDAAIAERVIYGNLPSMSEDDRVSRIGALCFLMDQCWRTNPGERPTAEGCRHAIDWMPKSAPSPREEPDLAAPRDRYAVLLTKLGMLHMQQDNRDEALKSFSDAFKVFTNNQNHEGRALALNGIAEVRKSYNEYSAAASCLAEVLRIYTRIGDKGAEANTLCDLASAFIAEGRSNDVTPAYLKALQIYTTLGDASGRANVLEHLARVRQAQGKYGEAISHYNEALQIYATLDDSKGRSSALCDLASVYEEQGRLCSLLPTPSSLNTKLRLWLTLGVFTCLKKRRVYKAQGHHETAISVLSEALQIFTSLQHAKGRAAVLVNLANTYRDQAKNGEAISHYNEALKIYDILKDSEARAETLYNLAEVYADQKQYVEATTQFLDALQLYITVRPSKRRADALARLGAVFCYQERFDKASLSYSEALKPYQDMGGTREKAEAVYGLGNVHRDQGKYEDAVSHYTEALEIYEAIGISGGRAETIQTIAMVRYKQGDYGRAISLLEQAATIFGQL